MNKLLLAALLTFSVGANANVVLNTHDFAQSVDNMTAEMTVKEKDNFLSALAKYSMFKKQHQDLSLSADEMNTKTFAEFEGLNAQEIMKSIELSYQVEKKMQWF